MVGSNVNAQAMIATEQTVSFGAIRGPGSVGCLGVWLAPYNVVKAAFIEFTVLLSPRHVIQVVPILQFTCLVFYEEGLAT